MKKIEKVVSFRLYPNKVQTEFIQNCFRTNKFIFNYFLRQQMDVDLMLQACGIGSREDRKVLKREYDLYFDKFEASRDLTQMGKTDEYSFLQKTFSTSKSYVLKDLDEAFKNISKQGSGFPKFKNKKSRNSFTTQIGTKTLFKIDIKEESKWGKLTLPIPPCLGKELRHKLYGIKINVGKGNEYFLENMRNAESNIKLNSFNICMKGNDYYINIQYSLTVEESIKRKTNNEVIGCDSGVERPITTSNIDDFDNPIFKDRFDVLKKNQEKKKELERILANKRLTNPNWKESKSYQRVKNQLTKLSRKIADQRKNRQHEISSALVNSEQDIIAFEKLNIAGMTKRSAKGKSNKKSNLNRVMLDVGISEIQRQTGYKANWKDKKIVLVDPKHTSQKCSCCGSINKLNRESQNKFVCKSCGHTMNADLNASINIKERAIEKIENLGEKAFE
jgi:putative transposase